MCQSKNEGGQRCFSHAIGDWTHASKRVAMAERDATYMPSSQTQNVLAKATAALEEAGLMLASTEKGEQFLTSEASTAAAKGDAVKAGFYDSILRRGNDMRQRAQAVRQAARVGQISHETTASIIDRVRNHGGLTVDPSTGAEPTSGFCINETGACPTVPDDEFFTPEGGHHAIQSFLSTHHAWFIGTNAKHIGFWHDRENQVVVMDRVDVVQGIDEATAVGKARGQRAMWDVQAGREIDLRNHLNQPI